MWTEVFYRQEGADGNVRFIPLKMRTENLYRDFVQNKLGIDPERLYVRKDTADGFVYERVL